MISVSMVKIAALVGMALVWWELTCESIKLGEKIILDELNVFSFFITMISASLVKIAALGGIALVWLELTCESMKLGEKIIFSSWLDNCEEDVCESCEQHIDDEEIYDGEELNEKKCEDPSCEICI